MARDPPGRAPPAIVRLAQPLGELRRGGDLAVETDHVPMAEPVGDPHAVRLDAELAIAGAPRQLEELRGKRHALVFPFGQADEDGAAAAQRGGEDVRVAEAARQLHRVGAERQSALYVAGVVELARELREHAGAPRCIGGAERRQRLFEQADPLRGGGCPVDLDSKGQSGSASSAAEPSPRASAAAAAAASVAAAVSSDRTVAPARASSSSARSAGAAAPPRSSRSSARTK